MNGDDAVTAPSCRSGGADVHAIATRLRRAGGLGRVPAGRAAAASSPARCCMSRATMPAWRGWPRRWRSSRRRLEVLRFPAWDCLPYDRVSPNPALVSERIATLARLLETPSRPRIVLTTVNALVQRVPPRAAFAGASLELRTWRHGAAGEAGPVPGGQRLWPCRHGDGAGRIRHARRHHRHFPGRRGRAGAAGPVRRHDRDRSASSIPPPSAAPSAGDAPDPAAGVAKCRSTRMRSAASAPAGASCSARPAADGSDLPVDLRRAAPSRHGALGAAVP